MRVWTTLTVQQLQAAEEAFGIPQDRPLTHHVWKFGISITALPGNRRGMEFLKMLCDTGQAELRF